MVEEFSLEGYKKAYRDIVVEDEKRGFSIHLVVYVLVNAMFIVVDLMYPPEYWFFYPLTGWGIGILLHYLSAVRGIDRELKDRESKAEYRLRETKSKG